MANRRFIDFPVATTVGANDIILIWQDGLNKQTTKATILSGLPEDLEDLADVNISGLTNGQILRYDSTTGNWVNSDQGDLNLNDLNDVSIVSPANGQVLVYNSSTSKWENSSAGLVPYVGAVTTVDLGAQGLRAGYIRFNTSVVSVPNEQGIMFWDADDETVDVILNGYTMKIGEDLFYPVKNQTGSTIAKGTAVRFNGTVGASGRLLIAPFIADGSVASSRFMGVTAEEILNGEDGKVLYFGRIRGINTNAFNEGDILYASTTVAGGFQTAIPVAPNNIVQVAAVVTKSINQGTIFVRPTLGSSINKDEGVKITSVANLDLLQYKVTGGVGLWENQTLAQVIGSAYVPSSRTLTINGTAQDLSANRTFNVGTVTSVTASSPLFSSGGTTPNITIQQATATQNGFLSSTDWITFNSKQNALTNPVTGTGTTNYLPKFTGTSTIGNSAITDDGASVNVISRTLTITRGNHSAFGFEIDQQSTFAFGSTNGKRVAIIRDATIADNGLQFGYDTVDKTGIIAGAATSAGAGIDFYTFNGSAWGNRARVTASGNLLIGTTTDNGARLQVSGAIYSSDELYLDNGKYLRFKRSSGGLSIQTLGIPSGTDDVRLLTTGDFNVLNGSLTNLMTVKNSGNVGIGTASPASKLQIEGTGTGAWLTINRTDSGTNVIDYTQSGTRLGYIGYIGSDLYLNNATASATAFFTNSAERMRITSSGNVLIGTTTDSGYKLNVAGEIGLDSYLRHNGDTDTFFGFSANDEIKFRTTGVDRLTIASTGAATFSSLGTGTVYSNGGTLTNTNPSDFNLKENIAPINYGLSEILQLNAVTFNWKNDTINQGKQYGFIAQEVEKIMPDLVKKGEYLGLDKEAIFTTLVKAIQELNQKFDNLKN
jgi:hypothetical protein